MMIVGENLRRLVDQFHICSANSFDQFSISLTLDYTYFAAKEGLERPINYNREAVDDCFDVKKITGKGLVLKPRDSIIACSSEHVTIPLGYFGLLQTKGSLARLFCTVHMCDGQIEPGFKGKITFEIVNLGPFLVRLLAKDNIAQLFIFSCSTSNSRSYEGRYFNADGPTLMKPVG